MNLIPFAYLQEVCFVSQNIDDRKFQRLLNMAQDDLRDILKAPFYNEIVTQYSATPSQLTSDNQALYDPYIMNYLAWQTYFNFMIFANSDSTPTGIREFNDENSTLLTDIKMHSMEKNIRERANKHKYNMLNFLREAKANDSTKYPLYTEKCGDDFSFAITSIGGKNDSLFKATKAIRNNE